MQVPLESLKSPFAHAHCWHGPERMIPGDMSGDEVVAANFELSSPIVGFKKG